jgi:hypothetical protein
MTAHRQGIDAFNAIADAWRYSHADVDEHLFWIKQHRETIRARRERPEYLAYAERRLAERFAGYRVAVRRISEAEADMDAAGIPFNRY